MGKREFYAAVESSAHQTMDMQQRQAMERHMLRQAQGSSYFEFAQMGAADEADSRDGDALLLLM
jgi:hypothetical protein